MKMVRNTSARRFGLRYVGGTTTCPTCEGNGHRRVPSTKRKGQHRIIDCYNCGPRKAVGLELGLLPIWKDEGRMTEERRDARRAELEAAGFRVSVYESAGHLSF